MLVTGADGINRDFLAYTPLVRLWAKKLLARLPASIEADDLLQVGDIALYAALRTVDGSAHSSIEPYLHARVNGAFIDLLRSEDWLSHAARQSVKDLEVAVTRFEHLFGHRPSDIELSAFTGKTLKTTQRIRYIASLRITNVEDPLYESFDDLHRSAASSEQVVSDIQQARLADEAISTLTNREQYVVKKVIAGVSLADIASELGVNPSLVSQIFRVCLTAIQSFLEDKNAVRVPASVGIAKEDPESAQESTQVSWDDPGDFERWVAKNLKNFDVRSALD